MILYCDTSALVKRYVEENRSDEVDSLWENLKVVLSPNLPILLKP